MAREFNRSDRVGRQMQKELAAILSQGNLGSGLGMVTVQAVRVNRDLSHAKVYVTLMGGEEIPRQLSTLNTYAGQYRHELGRRMTLRSLPALEFVYDESIENGAHLTNLIDRAIAQENEN
jgi:ribosome-binding factor A